MQITVKHLFFLLAATVALVVAAFALASDSEAGDAGTPHYPDLQTLTPTDIRTFYDSARRRRYLNFSNTVVNKGQGRLEMIPVHDEASETTQAYQRIYTHDASGNWTIHSTRLVGTFAFHVAHNHWHFDSFARYELRPANLDGSMGNRAIVSSGKVTFCIIDTVRVSSTLTHASSGKYSSCGQSAVQGLSVGWGDKYPYYVSGQTLDITNLTPGDYWLVSIADPNNRIVEMNENNNSAAIKVRITGSSGARSR